MNKTLKMSIISVIAIIVVTILGTTFAYFYAIANGNGDNITGDTFNFKATLDTNTIYQATKLFPLSNNLVQTAISKANNKCIDKNNRDVCSLYRITLSNTGDSITLHPYITTTSTTYTTTNLKAQLYDDSFHPVSDVMTVSNDSNGKVYFTTSEENLAINLGSSNKSYYLVVWIMETSSSQVNDQGKSFSGTITFEGENGESANIDFST